MPAGVSGPLVEASCARRDLRSLPARLALLNLRVGLVELLEVRLDDRAVELPADAAEVGVRERQAGTSAAGPG